jgi:hypothetical protein
MRKLILIIAAIAISSVGANAQDTFSKGTNLLKASIAFNSNGKPIALGYERGIANSIFGVEKLNLGIGAYVGFYGYSTSTTNYGATAKTSYTIIAPGITGNLHYQFIDKLDAYIGLSLGAAASHTSVDVSGSIVTASTVDFAWGLAAGVRYEITPKWGVFLEGGKGTGNVTLGAAYKF